MTTLVYDTESDGFFPEATKLHVIVTSDLEGNTKTYHNDRTLFKLCDGTIDEGVASLLWADKVVAHNAIGHDNRLFKKFYGDEVYKKLDRKTQDSLVMSQLIFSNEMRFHGLGAWGKEFGIEKPKHEDWSELSPEMIHRCTEDVLINLELYKKCLKEGFENESLKLEQDTYRAYVDNQTSKCHINLDRIEKLISGLEKCRVIIQGKLQDELGCIISRPYKTFEVLYKKDGSFRANVLNYINNSDMDIFSVSGRFSPVLSSPINSNSPTQKVKVLLNLGWVPDTYTEPSKKHPNGQPSLRDSSFKGVPERVAKVLRKQSVIQHRLGLAKGLLEHTDSLGLCHGWIQTSGCNTGRMKHKIIANIPKVGKEDSRVYLGKYFRSLFVADPGQILIGADLSGIEQRIMGHFTSRFDGGAYTKELLEGNIHQKNADLLGVDYDTGKTFGYAILYGAMSKRISEILNCSKSEAQSRIDEYWALNPALEKVKLALEQSLMARGVDLKRDLMEQRAYIATLGGRKVYVRARNSLLNALIQSSAAVIFKKWLTLMSKGLPLDSRIAIIMHDETQISCDEVDIPIIKQKLIETLKQVEEYYELTVPLSSDIKVGDNWSNTH